MSEQPEPVPRPLFEAALRVLRESPRVSDEADLAALRQQGPPSEVWFFREYADAAERIVRRAAACGVGEEEAK